jgi:hypothetical protein
VLSERRMKHFLSTQHFLLASEEDIGRDDDEQAQDHRQHVILHESSLQQPKRPRAELDDHRQTVHRAIDGLQVKPARFFAALDDQVTRAVDGAIDDALVEPPEDIRQRLGTADKDKLLELIYPIFIQ